MIIFLLTLITLAVALFAHVIYALAKGASLLFHFPISYRPFGYTALIMVGLWLCLFAYGNLVGRFTLETKQVSVPCYGLPKAFQGYRIVHISDFHLDGYMNKPEKLQRIVDEVNAQKADLIVFTGDLVSIHKSELVPCIPYLKQMKAKDGVISIMGNHDYMTYDRKLSDRERAAAVKDLQRMEREDLGWNLLLNENTFIHRGADSIAIVGSENENRGVHSVIRRANMPKALKGTEDSYRIILTHDPTHWRGDIVSRARSVDDGTLTLSGHTHSGQVKVLGFSVARFLYKEYDGLYSEGNQHLYVNIGLGGTMPMRVGATPEITVITLQ